MKAKISGISRLRIGVDGEGVTTLVAFMLCPLTCEYCLNPQTLSVSYHHKEYSPAELYDEIRKDELYFLATGGGVTFGGGEPLLSHQFIKEFRDICGDQWKINVETSLNVPPSFLETVIPVADEYLIDIKDMNPTIYKSYTGKDNSQVLKNLRTMAELGLSGKCVIRIPLIPGFNTSEDVAKSEAEVIELGFERIDKFEYDIGYAERKRNMQDA
ncbi:MAG: radical SAM protein [Bacteroidales bacterium]|nr:radical SAM protein [Bacteroidales bacterium]